MTRRVLRFALLADGTSDSALLSVIAWALNQHSRDLGLADPGFRPRVARNDFAAEIRETVTLFRPDILFVHRDAEAQDPANRRAEIPAADCTLVKVVPVRMTEAWLLFDEQAIRRAADRPMGRSPLDIPAMQRMEDLPDPKTRLREALLAAAEAKGRQRKRFQKDMAVRVRRVAELIDDFSPLRQLMAFRQFEQDCAAVLRTLESA
jgi:hypothetical protein